MTVARYGLRHVDLKRDGERGERLHASGWRQVWEHPSGLLAMRDPCTRYWVVSDGSQIIGEGWASSLRGCARRIEREAAQWRR